MNRLIACLNIYNEAEFIEQCLGAYIRQVDGLVAVDGAYASFPHDVPWSTDGTLDIVEALCEKHGVPHTIVRCEQAWSSQVAKRNAYLDLVDVGDWVFINDGDWETRLLYGAVEEIKKGEYDAYKITRLFMDERGVVHQIVWGNPYIIRRVEGMHYILNHYTIEDADGVNLYFPPYRVGDLSHLVKSFHRGEYRNVSRQAQNKAFYRNRVELSSGVELFACDSCGLRFRLPRGTPSLCPHCGDSHPAAPKNYRGHHAFNVMADVRGIFTFYQEIAEKYPESEASFTGPIGEARVQMLYDLLGEEQGLVLDLGCHDGYLHPKIPQYVGLDIALPCLKRFDRPRVWADAQQTPFRDRCVDVVICLEVLEHIYDRCTVLDECHRVLKDDGRLIISVPYGDNPYGISLFKEFERYGIHNRPYLHGSFNERLLTKLFALSGFILDYFRRIEGSRIIMAVAHKSCEPKVQIAHAR